MKDEELAELFAGMLAGHLVGFADPRYRAALTGLMLQAISEGRRAVAALTN